MQRKLKAACVGACRADREHMQSKRSPAEFWERARCVKGVRQHGSLRIGSPALDYCRARPMNPERRVEDPDWSGAHTGARCSGSQVRAAVSKSSSTTVCLLRATSMHSSKSGSGSSAYAKASRYSCGQRSWSSEDTCTCGSSSLVCLVRAAITHLSCVP